MNDIRFSIIIPHWRANRSTEVLAQLLDSCMGQIGFSEFDEMIVVNNQPDPIVESQIRILGRDNIQVLHSSKMGVNIARNLGAKSAKGNFLFFVDDDCILPRPSFLRELEQAFAAQPDCVAIGGGYDSPPGSSWKIRGYNTMTHLWIFLGAHKKSTACYQVSNLLGGNLCVRKEIFSRGHFFDEKIISGGDETEFLRRLRHFGCTLLYSPDFHIWHQGEGSWRTLFARAWKQGRAHGQLKSETLISTPFWKKISSFIFYLKQEPALLAFSLPHFVLFYFSFFLNRKKTKTPQTSPIA